MSERTATLTGIVGPGPALGAVEDDGRGLFFDGNGRFQQYAIAHEPVPQVAPNVRQYRHAKLGDQLAGAVDHRRVGGVHLGDPRSGGGRRGGAVHVKGDTGQIDPAVLFAPGDPDNTAVRQDVHTGGRIMIVQIEDQTMFGTHAPGQRRDGSPFAAFDQTPDADPVARTPDIGDLVTLTEIAPAIRQPQGGARFAVEGDTVQADPAALWPAVHPDDFAVGADINPRCPVVGIQIENQPFRRAHVRGQGGDDAPRSRLDQPAGHDGAAGKRGVETSITLAVIFPSRREFH